MKTLQLVFSLRSVLHFGGKKLFTDAAPLYDLILLTYTSVI